LKFLELLKILEIDDKVPQWNENRYLKLSRLIKGMSRSKRSVVMVKEIMTLLLVCSDVDGLKEDTNLQLNCINLKFKLLSDLARAVMVDVQELITNSSSSIHGKIINLLILCKDSIVIIENYLGIKFLINIVLPKSWFYLLEHNYITAEKLEATLL